MKKKHFHSSLTILPQWGESGNLQLTPPLETPQKKPEGFTLQKRQKPQISSIPGISPKQRDRYQVTLGSRVLGERLSIDEALELAKGGES